MENLKNIQPREDFNWEEFEAGGVHAAVSRQE